MRANKTYLAAFSVCGIFGDAAAAAQEATDMKLEDAGFIMRPADTPQKLKRLRLLPPRQFIRRKKVGRHYFLYADPDYCKCVFLGDQRAMNTYRDMVSPPPMNLPLAPGTPTPGRERAFTHYMNADMGGAIPDGDILDFKFR